MLECCYRYQNHEDWLSENLSETINDVNVQVDP